MTRTTHDYSLTSTQAGGAKSTTTRRPTYWRHTLQAEVTLTATGAPATATAGTLSVRGKLPGASGFQELGVISLTATDPVIFEGFYAELEAASTGFDADKTWTLRVVSGD